MPPSQVQEVFSQWWIFSSHVTNNEIGVNNGEIQSSIPAWTTEQLIWVKDTSASFQVVDFWDSESSVKSQAGQKVRIFISEEVLSTARRWMGVISDLQVPI